MGSTTALRIVRQYADAVSAKDLVTIADLFADDIVQHQPSGSRFSGSHRGTSVIREMFGGMTALMPTVPVPNTAMLLPARGRSEFRTPPAPPGPPSRRSARR
ncbi:hypothetical protein GCM10023080_026360 [Streptomyces pseudoechinosporeus]